MRDSTGLAQMIFGNCQPSVLETGFISIYHFAQQHYVQELGCPALEDESWDHLLFEEFVSSQQVNEEEMPAQPLIGPWAEMLEEESKARRNKTDQESTSWWHSVPKDAHFIPPASQRPAVQTGKVVAVDSVEFKVEQRIGEGGFGCVFRCYRQEQGIEADRLALKVRWVLDPK